jgi:membrane-anchored glycerophosphoryl diester phosphodiesterase (GDPDase)
MVSKELQEALQPIKRIFGMLWVSLTSALLLYVVVLILVARGQSGPVNDMDPRLRTALILLAIVAAVGSLYYRKHVRSDAYLAALIQRERDLNDVEDRARKMVAQAKTDTKIISQLASLTSFDRKRYCLAAELFLPFVLNLSLNESVALVGFVVALLSRDVSVYIPFAGIALLLNIYMRPDLNHVMQRCEQWRE